MIIECWLFHPFPTEHGENPLFSRSEYKSKKYATTGTRLHVLGFLIWYVSSVNRI